MSSIFAARLKQARESRGISQSELARQSGITVQSISSYESDDPKEPKIYSASKIAETLNVSLDWLCGINDEESYKQYDNCGEVIDDVFKLLSSFQRNQTQIDTEADRIILSIRHPEITQFFSDYRTMKSLCNNGTISAVIFDSWLESAHKKIAEVDIRIPDPYLDNIEDDDIP